MFRPTARQFLRNASYSALSNLFSLAISVAVLLIVPKFVGVREYGYWQLYLFYSAYVGFLHFGWVDGIYLRYGGSPYAALPKQLLGTQFRLLVASQALLGLIVYLVARELLGDGDRLAVIGMTCICMVLMNPRYYLAYILQSTNRIGSYARILLYERFAYLLLVLTPVLFGARNYPWLVAADLVSKAVGLLVAVRLCRDLVWTSASHLARALGDSWGNIRIGIALTLSNVASLLVMGVMRFGIEVTWGVEAFGQLSLVLGVSSLVLSMVGAVGVVMYPALRLGDRRGLTPLYEDLVELFSVLMLTCLAFYYPAQWFLSAWLPEYNVATRYIVLLLPLVVFEGRMMLLNSPFLNALRRERHILMINAIVLTLSLVLVFATTLGLRSFDLSVIAITLVSMLRCTAADYAIAGPRKPVMVRGIAETVVITAFVWSGWFVPGALGALLFALALLGYVVVNRARIRSAFFAVRSRIVE